MALLAPLLSRPMAQVAAAGLLTALALVLLGWWWAASRRRRQSAAGRATHRTLHAVSSAGHHLRDGLTPEATAATAEELRALLNVPAVALLGAGSALAWSGAGRHHEVQLLARSAPALEGRTTVLDETAFVCPDPDCPVRTAVLARVDSASPEPLVLVTLARQTSEDLVRSTEALGEWLGTQADLAEITAHRTRAAEAELMALRAQINPHFIYNCLAAIAAFVRTDPARARELLLDFADFSRYALARTGELAPLGDEYTNVDRYLVLEKARFGDRLEVRSSVSPEVLSAPVPVLAVQPLVENAVRHGVENRLGPGTVTLVAVAVENGVRVTVTDDGDGADPARVTELVAGADPEHVGLANVDARLRAHFGPSAGLHVRTAPGEGFEVSFTVPASSAVSSPAGEGAPLA